MNQTKIKLKLNENKKREIIHSFCCSSFILLFIIHFDVHHSLIHFYFYVFIFMNNTDCINKIYIFFIKNGRFKMIICLCISIIFIIIKLKNK